jgi:S-adenosylmethionine:tRNA ribosyltransferase-isomerase
MNIEDFNFHLPKELIADFPVEPRDSSKLLYINDKNEIAESVFTKILDFINPGDVLVFNDSKVIPAYLEGKIADKTISFNILNFKYNQEKQQILEILAKPSKLLIPEGVIEISGDFKFKILSKNEDSVAKILFEGDSDFLVSKLEKYGKTPLPPYILKKRGLIEDDKIKYQTVYANENGSVAAPTAGLHFTTELIERIKQKGVKICYVTLNVGAGTFLPVKVKDFRNHKMHSEFFNVSRETCFSINEAKKLGRKIICVGTTSLRAMESSVNEAGEAIPKNSDTNIFIYPGYKFKIVDKLITNFHLPKSTLLMLVSAFSGEDNIKRLYNYAIEKKLRFFSYGDACFLERK